MTKDLIDGHYSLSFNPAWAALENIIYSEETITTLQPTLTRVLDRPERLSLPMDDIDQLFRGAYILYLQEEQGGSNSGPGHDLYELQKNVVRSYWNSEDEIDINKYELNVTNGKALSLALGHIDHNDGGYILYFSFSGFAFDGVNSDVLEGFFNELEGTGTQIKGVIVDVRGNGGGDTNDLNNIWGHFIDKPLTVGYARYKSGEGRLDYTPPVAHRIINYPNGKLDVPIVLLADKFSVSCAEISTMIVKLLPQGRVIGERTWGGVSALTDNRIFNGGQFAGDALWTLSYTPSGMFTCANGVDYEGVGVPPDQEVAQDWEMFLGSWRDNVLEAAITYLDQAQSF
jgi:C-terminal processing protease CtpA/Prc